MPTLLLTCIYRLTWSDQGRMGSEGPQCPEGRWSQHRPLNSQREGPAPHREQGLSRPLSLPLGLSSPTRTTSTIPGGTTGTYRDVNWCSDTQHVFKLWFILGFSTRKENRGLLRKRHSQNKMYINTVKKCIRTQVGEMMFDSFLKI